MERSWFSKATASRYGLVAESDRQERPHWLNDSPGMAASIIPPPIVQSTYTTPIRAAPASSVVVAQLSPMDDRQRELEADLQFLLDAQAEGLLKGLEGGVGDDRSSTGSTTPTAQSVRSASARRNVRPAKKRPGLRSARKGIYNSIIALSAVKDEELQYIDEEVEEKTRTIRQIDDWKQKRQGLHDATHANDSEEAIRAQRLRQEADVMQQEINTVELQLSDLKARQKKLLREAAAAENAVQAKLASYTSSLRMLEADMQKFLSVRSGDERGLQSAGGSKESVWDLPRNRRTLEMAREQFTMEKAQVITQRQDVEMQKAALDDGAAVWKLVVAEVTDFERRLRASMSDLSSSHSAWEETPAQPRDHKQSLTALITSLQSVIVQMESRFKLAEERDWKLLIAAIGAELDALHQGEHILQNVLAADSTEDGAPELIDAGQSSTANTSTGDGQEIHDLDKSFAMARPSSERQTPDEREDDGPDPELLFSRQDLEH